ncbi:MAG: hypothetical protein ACFFEY_16205 [Candidatus Thorarchaeota archaeon]
MFKPSSNVKNQKKLQAILKDDIITDSTFELVDKVVCDFAPEIAHVSQFKEDESEEQQIKTGRLHEHRILGIFLNCYLDGKHKLNTAEVEEEYNLYFKEVTRSTVSTYLNMLKKELILYTERDGRLVNYLFFKEPPVNIEPFWFTRIFCVIPAYFNRVMKFCRLYIDAEKYAKQFTDDNIETDKEQLVRNFQFIIGIIILKILKNRCTKCSSCQFSEREMYLKIESMIDIAIKDRTDVLSNEITTDLIEMYSEIPNFNGLGIEEEHIIMKVAKEIIIRANLFHRDLEFQIMVSNRRKDLRLKQHEVLDDSLISIIND